MKGITMAKGGGPDVLRYEDVPVPKVDEGQVMIEVHATALNGADLLQRAGNYPPPPGPISAMMPTPYDAPHLTAVAACTTFPAACV